MRKDNTNQPQFNIHIANFEVEEKIINDKREFGRVRASLMKYLESKYGYEITRRALRRVNTRINRDYYKIKHG